MGRTSVGAGVLFAIVFLSSCASYQVRKQCEKTNWFEHGYGIAMRGERTNGDSLILSCEKAEGEIQYAELDKGFKAGMEKYCLVPTAFELGRNGQRMNFSFCEDGKGKSRQAEHARGLREFCQPDTAYAKALEGYKYDQICPQDLEGPFLVKYREGRKKYLGTLILTNETEIAHIESQINDIENQIDDLSLSLARLPRSTVRVKERSYNPDTKTYQEIEKFEEDEKTTQRRRRLENQMTDATRRIQNLRIRQNDLRKKILESNQEILSLR